MKTKLKSIHEEQYSDGTKTLGVLYNYSAEDDNWKDSFIYIFNHDRKSYIFFNTMIDMLDYMLYDNKKVKRAYMNEDEFDKHYDSEFINDPFTNVLIWV
jgi:hypothetical protein